MSEFIDSQRIEELLELQGKNKTSLAAYLEIYSARVGQLLKDRDCRVSQLVEISQYLNVDPRDLISKKIEFEQNSNRKQYINTKMKLIFNELADTISMVIADPSDIKDCNGRKTIEFMRLSGALEKVLNNPNPYPTHEEELTNILNETCEAYKKSHDAREKELLKYLQERIEKVMKEKEDENKL